MTDAATGLTSTQAAELLSVYGPNEIRDTAAAGPFKILLRQVRKNFVLYLLTLTAIVSLVIGKDFTGYVILMVILIVIATGFIQEYKAEKAIGALKSMIMPVSRVMRDGHEKEIPSAEIIPGDIVVLRTGERVPADCNIVDGVGLRVNESVLTGESVDVEKKPGLSDGQESTDDTLFMGSFVVAGKCRAKVTASGMQTKFGQIAGMISTAEKEIPLQNKVNAISKYMVIVGITAASLTGLILLLRADHWGRDVLVDILIVVIAFSVSSFPEGFPVVLIATLAAGVTRMAKRNAIVNRMSVIETLGETTVICSDKTGTITKGEMTVKKIYADGNRYDVTGVGYEAKGEMIRDGNPVEIKNNSGLTKLLKAAVVCTDSNIERIGTDAFYRITGSATEGALLILGAKYGLFRETFMDSVSNINPFDSKRKMMSVYCETCDDKAVYAKGAPEVILARCSHVYVSNSIEDLTDQKRQEILQENRDMNKAALRTLALAYKPEQFKEYTEDGLIFLGLVSMEDPPREEVKEAIRLCDVSGIRVKMITGDNPETARAIASQIGLAGEVLTGAEMDTLTDDDLIIGVRTISIFARVKPEDKLRIVRALKANGTTVTMTGDGVNDAPALKEAHIGIAMGINGTDVSRSVADITLKDDNFATIVNAIQEGRTVFNNIRKFVTYQLSCNMSDVIILFTGMAVAPFLGWYVPVITALQILFMNIVTDNMPAITLGFNPTSKDIMRERPRSNTAILTPEFIRVIFLNGAIMGAISFSIAYLSYNVFSYPPDIARTTVLISMIMMQIANAYNFRSFRYKVLNRGLLVNKPLFFATLASLCAALLILYTPLSVMFETTPLGIEQWMMPASAAFLIIAVFDVLKIVNNKTGYLLHHIH